MRVLLLLFAAAHTGVGGVLSFAPSPFPSFVGARRAQQQRRMATVDDNNPLQLCLDTLEKRVKQGPGALSSAEVSELEAAMEQIVGDVVQQEQSSPVGDVVQGSPTTTPEQYEALRDAALQLDATTVSKMLEAGVAMDERTTEQAFWAVVNAVDEAEAKDLPLDATVASMLHLIFDADLRHLQTREKLTTNVTCMQPDDGGGMEGAARRMNYIFDDSAHKDLPLMEGRKCEGGNCCNVCSRNIFPTFAAPAECSLETFPELASLTFNDLKSVASGTILQFVRLVERVRRTIAVEYGLPLKSILPLQAYSRKYVAGTTQKGGGGGEGDFVTLHTDEATHSGYHYSCVLYLSTQGEDFEGGDFVFNDPAPPESDDADADETKASVVSKDDGDHDDDEEPLMSLADEIEMFRYAGRKLTPFHPTRGAAVIFSSGWENMHEVQKITAGTRYAVPCFFTTCPVPEAAYEHMVAGKPKSTEDIADDWLHLLLAHRPETPVQSVGRVKELLMKWHYMCTPLSEH